MIMASSNDYRRQFCTLEEEVKNAIRDLMQSNNLTEIELDNETSINHQIGYYSDINGWMGQEIRKIEIINDTFQLTTIYEDELFNDSVPADEWVNILGAVEEQIEKTCKPRYYMAIDFYQQDEHYVQGYGDITYLDECESYPTLMDAKRKVMKTAMADTNDLSNILPIYTIYETKGEQTKPVSHMFCTHHCFLLGIEPPVVTDDLINQGMTNVYIHTL
jgi:hypothetical protein